jgi:hypothetical protein
VRIGSIAKAVHGAWVPPSRLWSINMTNSDIRNLALAAVGGALEFYEFVIFIFFMPIIAGTKKMRTAHRTLIQHNKALEIAPVSRRQGIIMWLAIGVLGMLIVVAFYILWARVHDGQDLRFLDQLRGPGRRVKKEEGMLIRVSRPRVTNREQGDAN